MALAECRFEGGGGLPVYGADVLADVAAEDPVADEGTQVPGDRAAQLNGEEGDALAVVDDVGCHDCAGGAIVYAPDALATVLLKWRIWHEVEVGYHLPQEHP